jgi:chromosome segregation protein
MRLKRLELQGFKSFLDRTILTFQPGVTGVVGPNGCGKSNIVDALMWVMGEQSPKHLRGDAMTDIIFNGSETKAPTSMAEVSLILDRDGVPLAPQFAAFDRSEEISITRRIYRDGTGEFLINKTQCRLKDIHELFMDTGVGRRAYSIIEQGQIDRMINTKPEERRFLFEEVAGITKYKAKRKEAERKLDQTRQNMLRLQDILAELEKQIRSLKIQATRARKYKELKVEMEAIDLHLLGRELHRYLRSIAELQERREALIRERSQSDAAFARAEARVSELEILRIDQEKAHESVNARERELSLAIQRLESQLGLFDERRKYLKQSAESGQREQTEIEQTLAQIREELFEEQAALDSLSASLDSLEEEIVQGESAVRQHQDQKFKVQQRRDSLQGKRNQLGQRQVSLQNQVEYARSKEAECGDRQAELDAELAESTAHELAQREIAAEADAKIESCGSRTEQAQKDVTELHVECQQISQQLSQMEDALFRAREEFHGYRSRLQSLKELQENMEGYSPTAREVLQKLGEEKVAARPLAEVMQPTRELEEHLEVLLGAEMNTLVVQTTAEAQRVATLIQDLGLERVKILALEELSDLPAPLEIPGADPVLAQVKVTPGYEPVARWHLGRTYRCASRDQLFELRLTHRDCTFFALDTRMVGHGDRSLASGNQPTRVGVFARRREIEELTGTCNALELRLGEMAQERERCLGHLQEQEAREVQLKENLSALHIERAELRKERERVQAEVARAERDVAAVRTEVQRNEAQREVVRQQRETSAEQLATAQAEEAAVIEELEAVERTIADSARQFEELGATLNEKKVERSRLGEKRNSLEYRLEKLAADGDQQTRRLASLREQRVREEQELESLAFSARDVESQREQAVVDRNAAQVEISDLKTAYNDTCNSLNALRDERAALHKSRESVLSGIQEAELKLSQELSQVENLKALSIERYQRDPVPLDETVVLEMEKLPLLSGQVGDTWETLPIPDRHILLQEHLKSLRDKVGRYGEVNLTAIQEFDEIQKRYDFLMEQKTDLESSIRILEEAIQKIDLSTKQRFEETFEAVNRKFTEIFPILFNGGKAELALTNIDSPLESGVDIMVQPPGKRLQSITLLSGGEKALTAVSLVLAIFARKPSPFCLLDEVDAPLDDANVSRFNTVVRKMAEKTQFIVITHNKKTMEIAEALYGVTMERAGISKMTSVRLN